VHKYKRSAKGDSDNWREELEKAVRAEEGDVTEILGEREVEKGKEYLCVAERGEMSWRCVGNRSEALVLWKKEKAFHRLNVPFMTLEQSRVWQKEFSPRPYVSPPTATAKKKQK